MGPKPSPTAEKALTESVALEAEIRAARKTLGALLTRRNRMWKKAIAAPNSAVTQVRIAQACRVSTKAVAKVIRGLR